MSILEDVEYVHLLHRFWDLWSDIYLVGHWECKIKQITQTYCVTRQNNIIHLCESQRKDIDDLAQKVNVNPEMRAIYDEKYK